MGVDYIYGRAESTGGILWVVGKDPDLFNYFYLNDGAEHPNAIFHEKQCFLYPDKR
jgi:hypothetical protein